MRSLAIVDSGPLIAVANRRDPDHQSGLAVLQDPSLDLIIPALCVAEVAYLLGQRLGARVESQFLRGLRQFEVRAPQAEDWQRISDLVEQYRDLPLGGTDASVVALAEAVATDLLVTLDHRHFGVVRPRHCRRFQLLP